MSSYEIYTIFQQFGQIKMVTRKYNFYDITMWTHRFNQLKNHSEIEVNNHLFTVGWLGDRMIGSGRDELIQTKCQQQFPLTPFVEHSTKHILSTLNDDCLRLIFESSTLNLWDLISIANVCKRFKRIANLVFRSKYRDLANKIVIKQEDLWQTEEFVRTFGDSIAAINLTQVSEASTDIELRMIIKYCKNVIELECEVHEEQTIIELHPIITKLEKLDIRLRDANDFLRLFDVRLQYQLEKLKAINVILPEMPLPRLRELYAQANDTRKQLTIEGFFAFNRQLECLTLSNYDFDFSIGCILRYLPNLIDLGLEQVNFCAISRDDGDDVCAIAQLKQLKSLRIRVQHDKATVLLLLRALYNGRVQLERLVLEDINEDDDSLIDAICRLKSIRQLKMDHLNEKHLLRLAHELINLDRIGVESDRLPFYIIRDTLRKAKRLTRAKFKIRSPIYGPVWLKETIRREIEEIKRNRHIELKIILRKQEFPIFAVRFRARS